MRRNRDLPVCSSLVTTEIEKEMRVWPLNDTDNLQSPEAVAVSPSEMCHIRKRVSEA